MMLHNNRLRRALFLSLVLLFVVAALPAPVSRASNDLCNAPPDDKDWTKLIKIEVLRFDPPNVLGWRQVYLRVTNTSRWYLSSVWLDLYAIDAQGIPEDSTRLAVLGSGAPMSPGESRIVDTMLGASAAAQKLVIQLFQVTTLPAAVNTMEWAPASQQREATATPSRRPEDTVKAFIQVPLKEDTALYKPLLAEGFVYAIRMPPDSYYEMNAAEFMALKVREWATEDVLDVSVIRIRVDSEDGSEAEVSAYYDETIKDAYGVVPELRAVVHFQLVRVGGQWRILVARRVV